MNAWTQQILSRFTPDLARLWVASDPDAVLLDEKLLAPLRERGFEVRPYEDPCTFRAEFEERYRAAWDRGDPGPAAALVIHVRDFDPHALPWDLIRDSRLVRLGLAELFSKLAPSAVAQVEAEQRAALFAAHEAHLQSARGENESKDFILEHVYQLVPRAIRSSVDFWRELLRMHFANRALPESFAARAAKIIQENGLLADQPVQAWLTSKSELLRVVQAAWSRYLSKLGLDGSRATESPATAGLAPVEVPFEHTDVQAIVDSMFLNGTLQPVAVQDVPARMPGWIKTGIVRDPAALRSLVLKGIEGLVAALASPPCSHKQWSEFAKRYGEILARAHSLPGANSSEPDAAVRASLENLYAQSDQKLQDWVVAQGYADLIFQPVTQAPVMVHHIPRFLHHRSLKHKEDKIALLVFDGLAFDQWVQIRERLLVSAKRFAFDEGTVFAWLPTVTSVSRQALFSGLRPRDFAGSITRTDSEGSLWKQFWQDQGVLKQDVLYERALRRMDQLDRLEQVLSSSAPRVLGLVIDEVDDRIHKEQSKRDVALWIGNWLASGFVDRLFAMLLDQGYSVYLTADHGNIDAVGVGRPNQGVIAETRGERVRVYRSQPLLDHSDKECPGALKLGIDGLPADFLPLFAGSRTAFVPAGERAVVHGGVSIEELIVPFVKVSYVTARE